MFKGILTFLGLNYRDVSLITLYFVVLGIIIPIITTTILTCQINGRTDVRTDGRTYPNYRKPSLLKIETCSLESKHKIKLSSFNLRM